MGRRGTSGAQAPASSPLASRPSPLAPPPLPRRLVLVFAVACGVVVANLYYAQPVLDSIAREFGASSARAGLVVTATQLGYALGLLLVVPLGDLLDRRRLVLRVLGATTLALLASAAAPGVGALAAAGALVGVTSVVVQVLVPFAASLAGDRERGRVVGTVMSGLLFGILLARTVAGLIGQLWGWRVVYAGAAALMVALILVLRRELPGPAGPLPARTPGAYRRLLASVGALVRAEPVLRRRMAYGGLVFASFSVFWTSLAFLLARPPYGYGQATIGLFGLLGAAGALCASFAGRLADRGATGLATGGFLGATLAAFGLLALGGHSLTPLLAGVVLLDLGVQGAQVTNQSVIYGLRPDARSRVTTAYMTTYFAGGSLGSATAAAAFARAGWPAVCLLGAGYVAAALLLWATELRRG